MIDRIQKIIQLKKLNSSAFADKVGVPRSTISHILSGRNNPSLEFIQKVLDTFPEIKTEWLVRGDGHMLKATNTLFPDEEYVDTPVSGIPTQNVISPDFKDGFRNSEVEGIEIPRSEKDSSDHGVAKKEILKTEEVKKIDETTEKPSRMVPEKYEKTDKSDKNQLKTVRVLLFYSDGSFSEHFPER
jgi:transcriptional regulator with XRE-family HTH domain